MKANEININRFLSQSETQFIIPVYQRNYDWNFFQCKQLFDDIIAVGSNDSQPSHFIGSIVYIHDDIYSASGIRELSIIDGQQRLTTITLIYISVFNIYKEQNNYANYSRIEETYLINKFAEEREKLKLKPTENNDKALKFLLRSDDISEYNEFSMLVENYIFFRKHITTENLETVIKGLNKLIFVEVSLERDKDDPQKIFESLNSTGLELSQSDLIRNYILMGLKHIEQKRIYEDYWKIIEENTTELDTRFNKVSDFIRDFLTLENREIPNKNKVYQEFKKRYPVSDFESLELVLKKIKKFSYYYNKLINPANESSIEIRDQINFINKLEVNVAYPFLLEVYDDYSNAVISKDIFIETLEIVQSFSWRRFIVGLPTNALNKIFMRLYEDVERGDYISSIQKSLVKKKGTQRFPEDNEVVNTLRDRDMYNIQPKNRSYFFEKIENFDNREYVKLNDNPKITIEHIFPQNPEIRWKYEIGDNDFKEMKEKFLNTVANLTLSGNNNKLSNKSFSEKKIMNEDGQEQGYIYSRLWLNRFLSSIDKWGIEELNKRFEIISERFLKVWKYPSVSTTPDDREGDVNIFDAEDPSFKKLEYIILLDQKIEVKTITEMYSAVTSTLFELSPQTFFNEDIASKLVLSKSVQGLDYPIPLNDFYFIEGNLDSISMFDKVKSLLLAMNITDELYIRYS